MIIIYLLNCSTNIDSSLVAPLIMNRQWIIFYLLLSTAWSKDAELSRRIGNRHQESDSKLITADLRSNSKRSPISCPLWHYFEKSRCKCGNSINGFINCSRNSNTSVLSCNCVTYNEDKGEAEVGKCIYNCDYSDYNSALYLTVPSNVTEVEEFMCGRYNRNGTLCGRCKEGHYPLVYSFDMNCVRCPNGSNNWWKFMLAAFLPLTLWYIVVLLFRISVASSLLHGFVLCSQGISMPAIMRASIIATTNVPNLQNTVRFLGSVYGIWNLDFFRLMKFNICLGTDNLQTLMLDYMVGIYPFLLMIATYFLIDLHDHNCKPLIIAWKPIRTFLSIFRQKWEIKTSLVDAFTTFFLLSNIKILSVSFDVLTPVKVYTLNSTGYVAHKWMVFSDASIPYFRERHLPYAILALVIFVLFVIFPIIILILYPCNWFQKFLNLFPFRWYILHTFMDSFQGCYKDGTEPGTRDCRWFSSMFLLLRLCLFLIGEVTAGIMYFVLSPMLLVLMALLLIKMNPFKKSTGNYTNINICFILLLALWYATCIANTWASYLGPRMAYFLYTLSAATAVLPLLFLLLTILYWIYTKRSFGSKMFRRICAIRHG